MPNPYTCNYGEAYAKFLHYYEPERIVMPITKKMSAGPKVGRACKFCIQETPAVTFHNDAHVLPQLMGNRYLLHNCECDSCNRLFGKYEDSLSKYMGMMRTADAMKGKSGVPTFKSADGKLRLQFEKDETGKPVIQIYDGRENVERDLANRTITITAKKQSYIPLHVMKCFYKIGYSIVDPNELLNFQSLRKIITSNRYDDKLSNFAQVVKFTLPKFTSYPMVFLFKKIKQFNDVNMPSKVIKLYFGRYMYEYFLIDQRDKFLFNQGEKCQFLYMPPYYEGSSSDIFAERIDLSDRHKKIGEIDSIQFSFDP